MKLYIYKITFLVFFLLIVICGYDNKKRKTSVDSPNESEQVITNSENENKLSLKILNSYYDVKNALVESDFNLAKIKAGNLAEELKKDNDTAYMIILAEAIAGAQSIDDQRMEFDKLSKEMYTLAKASKFHNVVIYRLYCPMAFENKGAFWLSDQKEILNPYFGDKMLHCGRLEETISR